MELRGMSLSSMAARIEARPKIAINELDAEDLEPTGDRYTVEVAEFDEQVVLGKIFISPKQPSIDPRDPLADPKAELRGVFGAIICGVGSGHLLGIPDILVVKNPQAASPEVTREWASVDMFHAVGDVVFVHATQRGAALHIIGRDLRIINQMDILANITHKRPDLKYVRVGGVWRKIGDL